MVLGAGPAGKTQGVATTKYIMLAIDGGGKAARRPREVCFGFYIVAALSFSMTYVGM